MGEADGHGLEETWEKTLLEADFPQDIDLDFFGEFNSLVEPEGFPLQSVLLQDAPLSEHGDDSTTLSSMGDEAEGDAAAESDANSDTTAKKQLWKRNKREREKAVRSRKRKRAQMERLLNTTRQLQAQNAQLLRTLGAVQQMAEEKDMTEVARMAASASNASLTELEASEVAIMQEAGAASGTEEATLSSGKPDGFDVKKDRQTLKAQRIKLLEEGVRILNGGDRDQIEAMCEALHHPNVTLRNPDLSHESRGLKQLNTYWRGLSVAFPDFKVSIEDISEEDETGDKLKLRWKFKGTQVEPFLPVLPAGRFIELSGNAFLTFRGAKIAKHIWSWNHTGLLLNLIGYETKDTEAGASSAPWESAPSLKAEPRSEQTPGSTDGEALPSGPKNMQTRIAETISSMVRSISAGNLALKQASSGTPARMMKRAKSTADIQAVAPEQLMKHPPLKVPRGSPRSRPRARAKPKYKSAPVSQSSNPNAKHAPIQHMLGLPQAPYLIPNAHMLPGFPMTSASGIFVALPQNQIQIANSGNQAMSPNGHSEGAAYSH
uniref:BZIP domain-containing protein n=1 Tax=Pinguiococcus pyrenoidosus TaxID=172671 RepID=A0A7R9YGW1_9STRA|mmetsp:Transcript_9856/g.37137  ORF Transcript_9856/g.37137 Transcript_9856/m.37137 type:complete len:547 (+) Transcript_9856:425-2065(+)